MTTLAVGRGPSPIAQRVIAAIWRREHARYARDRFQIFGAISRTVLWLAILGFGLGATLCQIEGYSYAQYIFPSVAVLDVLFASMQSAFALVYDRQHGLLRQVLISPAPMRSITLGKLCSDATVATVKASIPLLLVPFIGIPITIPGLLTAWSMMFAIGLGLTGRSPRGPTS